MKPRIRLSKGECDQDGGAGPADMMAASEVGVHRAVSNRSSTLDGESTGNSCTGTNPVQNPNPHSKIIDNRAREQNLKSRAREYHKERSDPESVSKYPK